MGDFIDIFSFRLDERAPRVSVNILTPNSSQGADKSDQADYLNSQGVRISQEFVPLWNESAAELDRELLKKKDSGTGSILAYLYWRY